MNNQRLTKRKQIQLLLALTILICTSGIFVRLGTRTSDTKTDITKISLEFTGRDTDVAIKGAGFFRVKVLSTIGDGTAYTRNGNFFLSSQGRFVLGIGDGYELDSPITIPAGISSLQISHEGIITGIKAGASTSSQLGQFQLTQFVNPQGLRLLNGSLYQESRASGSPIVRNPGEPGTGTLLQKMLEISNVDAVNKPLTLIKTQRSFELNSQSIQTADQALQTITNLRRS